MSVKKRILAHEYDEMVQDQYSEFGHLELVIRQGKSLGMSSDELLQVKNLSRLPELRCTAGVGLRASAPGWKGCLL
jgi:hypothetical protein